MQPKLLTEFPSVSYDAWRAQVEQDLKSKGADFEKRLLSRTLEMNGLVIRPLYTHDDIVSGTANPAAPEVGLPQSLRASTPAGVCDLRAEQASSELDAAHRELTEDLAAGATSLWLRFDAEARTGDAARATPDGLHITGLADLSALLAGVDLARVGLALDVGGNVALGALLFAHVRNAGVAPHALHGTLGCDPLGAWARDGALPYALDQAPVRLAELCRATSEAHPQLRAAQVASDAYHLAGASCTQELAYALATGCEYLRWCLNAGMSLTQASQQIGFRLTVSSDLFLELAKLRALRLAWAKIIAAHGDHGDPGDPLTHVHAVTSARSQTRRDPWVNMLRTTTEAFAALVGGADAVTTRAFDSALGHSDGFARRIARNVQVILNEEAHVNEVADAAGGSYYVESLTDQLARAAFQLFQAIERQGGMSAALASGQIARDIATTARDRAAAIAKRLVPITGVSEFANLSEEPVRREPAKRAAAAAQVDSSEARAALVQLEAAASAERIPAAVQAAQRSATLSSLTHALAGGSVPARGEPLPVRRNADGFETLRERSERHAANSGQAPRAFLCNLGEIPKHKARASFASGFCNAGGIVVLDNDGFETAQAAVEAFSAAGTDTVVICGSDDQYPEWVPALAPALRAHGARQILLAGRPGDRQSSYEQAGVNAFIFVGVDVVTILRQLLDGMGVAE